MEPRKYVRGYIKNIFNFYDLFLKICRDIPDEDIPEIIQSEIANELKNKTGKKIGESTLIKYIEDLHKWGLINIKIRKRKGRYAKHISPTIKGILLLWMYNDNTEYIKKYIRPIKNKIKTIDAILHPDFKKTLYNIIKNTTLMDFSVIYNAVKNFIFQRGLRALNPNAFMLDINIFNKIQNTKIEKMNICDLQDKLIPHKVFNDYIDTIKELNDFIEKIDIYLLTLFYAIIKFVDKPYISSEIFSYNILNDSYRDFKNCLMASYKISCIQTMFDTLQILGQDKDIFEELSNITNIDKLILQKESIKYTIEKYIYNFDKELRIILKKYNTRDIKELFEKLDSEEIKSGEAFEDANKAKDLEEKIKALKIIKEKLGNK